MYHHHHHRPQCCCFGHWSLLLLLGSEEMMSTKVCTGVHLGGHVVLEMAAKTNNMPICISSSSSSRWVPGSSGRSCVSPILPFFLSPISSHSIYHPWQSTHTERHTTRQGLARRLCSTCTSSTLHFPSSFHFLPSTTTTLPLLVIITENALCSLRFPLFRCPVSTVLV